MTAMTLWVLLKDGNEDCNCGDEFCGFTDNKEIADLWDAIPFQFAMEWKVNEFADDGRSAFQRKAKRILEGQ